jgi:hypothetical protein
MMERIGNHLNVANLRRFPEKKEKTLVGAQRRDYLNIPYLRFVLRSAGQ